MAHVFGDRREGVSRRQLLDRHPASSAGDGAEPDGLPAEILSAWRRAREASAEPGRRRCARLLEPAELALRLDRDETFRLATPILDEFGPRLAECQQVVAFFDASGWMLSLAGDRDTARQLAEIDFRPGSSWRDEPAGTAGPAAALAERRAREGVAAWPSWGCSPAAIHAPGSGELRGAVGIAGPRQVHEAQALVITVRAVARAVEERLRSIEAVRAQVVEYAFRRAAASGDALVAVNARGGVLAANDAARRLALEGRELPAGVREPVEAALAQRRGGDAELLVDWPGVRGKARLAAYPVSFEQNVVGALLRVDASAPSRARAAPRRAAGRGNAARYDFDQILGESEAIRQAIALARTASRNELPVVLLGESGTGKELFAQAIHSASERAAGPFVAVNCGCIPAALVEAELFGYEAGTFTGARKEGNAGKFEEADGGTIFLDEVSELSAQAQTALLRVLQEREVVPLGASTPRRVDIRVIAASNKGLLEEIRAGRFRSDLYFRLNVLGIGVPPLRTRRADVGLLARAFLRDAEGETGRSGLALSDGALRALEAYDWPGNVRELHNVMLRVAATAPGALIEEAHLPEEVRPGGVALAARLGAPPPAAADHPDREELVRALEASAWNVAKTAQALDVSRMTLYRWLRKHGIER